MRAPRRSPPASAATMAVFQALAPGDHVMAPLDAYFGTGKLLRDTFAPWGLAVDVRGHDRSRPRSRRRSGRSTKIVWVETPSNPLWRVTDVARSRRWRTAPARVCVCDNTSATRPAAAAGAGRRPGRARDDQIPGRPRRRAGRRRGGARRRCALRPRPRHPGLGRRRAVAVRLLARAPRHPHAALAHARALRQRAEGGDVPGRHPRVEAVHYPGLASHPARRRAAAR